MDIGSFIGLELRDSGEYYWGTDNIARLNSARAGILHACKLYGCKSIHLPYYLCPSVKSFLVKNGIRVKSYYINERFEPTDLNQQTGHAVLLVNYFGIVSTNKIHQLAEHFTNVIVDNSAAFYSSHFKGCYSVYSARKFFGVPDGCYVIGDNAGKFTSDYSQDISSVTSSYLLKRIEFGLSDTYADRLHNEDRINNSGILRMSKLTRTLLNSIDYQFIKSKRQDNFKYAHRLFHKTNKIIPTKFMDPDSVPMVYPLVIENADLNNKLKENHIYTGRWWNNVLTEVNEDSFEAWMSNYMIPLPVDQRYSNEDIKYIHKMIANI